MKTTLLTTNDTKYQLCNRMPTARQRNRGIDRTTKQSSHPTSKHKSADGRAHVALAKATPKRRADSNCALSKALQLNWSVKSAATWANIFDWQRMEVELEAAASRSGDSGDHAVHLTYQKMGSIPLRSDRTYASDFTVPMNLRPEEQIKWAIKKATKPEKAWR
ncbi:hypothetical protein P171DRAFT_476814 [Karstenula rhodostoma CBS 690.94]|uniref:Uncharacterized protein n=1 Tax=Karstenula rhodostoma CBS 690.94 TaxID=1392251 RepID=A0A9P4P7L0_9PLEO|nr:hypothetical protein P171DRAFT_476814 [Karstenula rhodostoma CBS 690.94]